MNTNNDLLAKLKTLGLNTEEARIYLELLASPTTHLALSQTTGINRTKVYRIVQDLEQRSLVARRTDDRGTFLTAVDPSTLEIAVIEQERRAMEQRGTLHELLPTLLTLQSNDVSLFASRSYDGAEGLKQMCWHELKAQDELLVLGGGAIEDMIPNHYWAEKHRALNVEAGYRVLEIVNPVGADIDSQITFTQNSRFMELYDYRILPVEILALHTQTTIYNDTVAIYHWREDQKSGVEIINKSYADTMRQIFWYYWRIANALTPQAGFDEQR